MGRHLVTQIRHRLLGQSMLKTQAPPHEHVSSVFAPATTASIHAKSGLVTLLSVNAVSILKKMGPGRLPGGHKSLMTSLPPDWGQFRQRIAAKQQPTATEAPANSEGPSRPFSDSLKGKLEKVEGRSKLFSGGAKGKLEKPEGPSRSSDVGAKGKTKKADDGLKPHDAAMKGRTEKAQGPSRPFDADANGTSERPKGIPQSSDVRASGQPKEMSSKASVAVKATKDDQTNRRTHGQNNGQTSGQAKDEKAGGTAAAGQKRPAWGAPQAPSKAARVAEGRTFKVRT